MSQETTAERSGVGQETISRIEKRGPAKPVIQAIRLARALGVTVEALFGRYADAPTPKRERRSRMAPRSTG